MIPFHIFRWRQLEDLRRPYPWVFIFTTHAQHTDASRYRVDGEDYILRWDIIHCQSLVMLDIPLMQN